MHEGWKWQNQNAPVSCARLLHPIMIAWCMVGIGTWTTVDRVGCWFLWQFTTTESHRATRVHRPGTSNTCTWSRLVFTCLTPNWWGLPQRTDCFTVKNCCDVKVSLYMTILTGPIGWGVFIKTLVLFQSSIWLQNHRIGHFGGFLTFCDFLYEGNNIWWAHIFFYHCPQYQITSTLWKCHLSQKRAPDISWWCN